MKYFKEYSLFLESSEYDSVVLNMLSRIEDIFDISKLTLVPLYEKVEGPEHVCYVYQLEETDSESGFIKISVLKNKDARSGWRMYYKLKVDNQEVDCSENVYKKYWEFFASKYKEKISIDSNNKLDDFKNRYGHI